MNAILIRPSPFTFPQASPRSRKSVAFRVPAHAPWLARRSMARRATRMTCHAPVRRGCAVGAFGDLD